MTSAERSFPRGRRRPSARAAALASFVRRLVERRIAEGVATMRREVGSAGLTLDHLVR